MVLTAVYLHKRKAEEVKAGLGVLAGVLFPPVCVCDVGYCWVLILTVRGQWARVLLKHYLIERRIGPNPGQSLLTPALKPRHRGSGSCVCEARELSRCFSLCFLQYSAVKWRRRDQMNNWRPNESLICSSCNWIAYDFYFALVFKWYILLCFILHVCKSIYWQISMLRTVYQYIYNCSSRIGGVERADSSVESCSNLSMFSQCCHLYPICILF